jgi:hypothetical protein
MIPLPDGVHASHYEPSGAVFKHSPHEWNFRHNSERLIFRFTFFPKLFAYPSIRETQLEKFIMKKTPLFLGAPMLALTGALVLANFGCEKKPAENQPPASTPKVVSVTKTSFNEVTAQLDPGGNFYMYLGTAQWLDSLSIKVNGWRQTVLNAPNLKPDDAANVNKAFDIVTRLITDSGIEDVSGVGLSSVEIEKGMFRNKALVHHYSGKGTGFLWQLAGQGPHALTGLDLLPTDTALAIFTDLDVQSFWNAAQKEISQANIPQAQAWLDKLPGQFEEKTQVKWDAFIKSLGGEFGLVLTLDRTNNIPVPLPGGAISVPAPGLMLVVRVNDDTVFNRLDQQLKANEQVISTDKAGVKMRTMPVPVPFLGTLRPSAASSGGYLFISSSDDLINEALAVKSGQIPGLKSTDEFKHLSQGIPDQGNQFSFMSERFAKILMQVQQQSILANAKAKPEMAQWLQSLFRNRPAFAYCVGINTPEGCLTVGNGSQSYAVTALMPAMVVPGLLAAIAVPNFVKARTTSQQNACINNLRQLDAAKNQWALEKSMPVNAVPTKADLLPYLQKWPVCPAGGTYELNSLDHPPTCSIPSHHLPQ